MYRMAVLAMLMSDHCDRAKCIRMSLVHDLAEAIIGDITPHCGVPAEEKHLLEDEVCFPESKSRIRGITSYQTNIKLVVCWLR